MEIAEPRVWSGWPSSYGPEPRPCGGPGCSRRAPGFWCRGSRAGGSGSWAERRCSSSRRPSSPAPAAGGTPASPGRPPARAGTTSSRTGRSPCATGAAGTAGGCCWRSWWRWPARSRCLPPGDAARRMRHRAAAQGRLARTARAGQGRAAVGAGRLARRRRPPGRQGGPGVPQHGHRRGRRGPGRGATPHRGARVAQISRSASIVFSWWRAMARLERLASSTR